ncbi:MAG TPA: hypothetical protein VMZ53_03855 [Kofleriaceae bacterium]|nr:hypothetical protein [Kofleriaceae bacterium]
MRYSVDNRAGRTGTQGLTQDVRTLGNEAKRTSGVFGRLGLAVAGAFGARAAGKALIGFNSTVQDTKNQIAGMLALSKKTDLSAQVAVADRLYGRLQTRAKSLPGTTQEYVQMLGMLTQPLSTAGATLKEMEDLTVNAVVGAKALGISWDVAARDIDQALRGQYHSVDQFTGKILGSMGYGGEEGRAKFNGMSAGKRKEVLQAALMQKQLTQLAAAQGASFSGMLSTLQDTVEQFLGKVGAPLFRVITNELKQWNGWIEANGDKIDAFASKLGEGLVTGFRFVKDALSFLVDHADLLLMVGKVWAGVKIGGMLTSGVGKLGGAFGAGGKGAGFLNFFKGARDGVDENGGYQYTPAGRGRSKVGGLKGAMGNLELLGGSAALGYALGNAMGLDEVGKSVGAKLAFLTGRADGTTEAMDKLKLETDRLAEATRKATAANPGATGSIGMSQGVSLDFKQQAALVEGVIKAEQKYKSEGGMDNMQWLAQHQMDMQAAGIDSSDFKKYGGAQGFVDAMRGKATEIDARNDLSGTGVLIAMNLGVQKLTEYQRKTLETAQAQEELSRYMTVQLSQGKLISPETVMEILRHNTQDPTGSHKSIADKPKVSVNIARIEVQSDDPDRMAFGLIEAFRDAAKNPSSALSSLREG